MAVRAAKFSGQGPTTSIRSPDNHDLDLKSVLLASVSPAVGATVQQAQKASGGRARVVVPEALRLQRAVRAQAIAYEVNANDGRYTSRTSGVAMAKKDNVAHPLMWAVVPVGDNEAARFFSRADDAEGMRLHQQLFRSIALPGQSEPTDVVLLPVHWEEAETLRSLHPQLLLVSDGQIYRGSSPRSLFIGTTEGQQPELVTDIENYSLKMHLSAASYARLGGLGGSREINFNDALFATVLSQTFIEATKDIPLIEVQSEARAVAATIGSGPTAVQVGAIFRTLQSAPAVPGFAFFSPTTEQLPGHPDTNAVGVRATPQERCLAADAILRVQQKNPGMSAQDAFLKLFVDPLLEVNFKLAKQGWSMELHPQNFLLRLDEKTGLTNRVVIRDLHGLGYSAKYRSEHGLPDQMSVESLKKQFPAITQEDVEGYFHRDGELRDRYRAPKMFEDALDFFTSIFWYQLLDAVKVAGIFTKPEITALVESIKDRVQEKATELGFDLSILTPPAGNSTDNNYWTADKNGIRGRILFRRAV